MKKVLVITLVLVMAFASSAMAAVTFSGNFTATAKMTSFKVFTENYSLDPTFEFNMAAANKSETEEVVNWDFSAGLKLENSKFEIGKYKLGLYDEYFKIWAWGNEQDLTAKSTYFGMIEAGKTADAGTMRARAEVPVMDLAKVTVDLTAPAAVRAFVDATVEGFDVGLGYLRDWNDAENALNVIVAQVGTAIPAGDIEVALEAAGGVTLGDNLGFAVGFGVDSDVTEELNLNASVEHANAHWAGDGVDAEKTVIGAGATYTETAFQVGATGTFTIEHAEGVENSNELTLTAKYRMSDALAYKDLFATKDDKWATNIAPAFGASVKFADLKFDNVRVDATSPVLEDMIWVKAYGTFKADKSYGAGVLGHILATDKLTVRPSVDFASAKTTTDVKLVANYKIGASTTLLTFTAQKVFAPVEDDQKSLLQLSVKVPF